METIELTPDYARELLESMVEMTGFGTPINDIEQATVDDYAAAMTAGEWQLREPLWLTACGRLLNGQHRCAAVIQSGETIVTYLARVKVTAEEMYRRAEALWAE
jgi:hypothetical protein